MDIAVPPAGPTDAAEVVRVHVDSWNRGFGNRMPSIDAGSDRIERWRTTPTRWWLAESADSSVVGFVGIGPSRDPIDTELGELDTIAGDPGSWHSGIGKRLMAVALAEMRAQGYKSGVLWTLSDYPLGERFYMATGWCRSSHLRAGGAQVRYDHDFGSVITRPEPPDHGDAAVTKVSPQLPFRSCSRVECGCIRSAR